MRSPHAQAIAQRIARHTTVVVHQDNISVSERCLVEASPQIRHGGQFKVTCIVSPVDNTESVQHQHDQSQRGQFPVRRSKQIDFVTGDLFELVTAAANVFKIVTKGLTTGTPVTPRVAADRMPFSENPPERFRIPPCAAADREECGIAPKLSKLIKNATGAFRMGSVVKCQIDGTPVVT